MSGIDLTTSDVVDVVVKLLAAERDISAEAMMAELAADGDMLPIDSLLLQEILARVEEQFEVQLPDTVETARSMASVRAFAQAIVDAAVKQFGRLDILVNNSGVYGFAPIESVTEEDFHRHFNVNVLGLLLTTQAASKHLGEGSSIINIGSVVTRITPPGSAIYTGTKGAVDAITGVLSRELGPRKIRVNALNPGMIETEGTHAAGFIGSDFEADAIAKTPLGRIGQPNDIASIAVFLASDDSYWLTGEQLLAGGGVR